MSHLHIPDGVIPIIWLMFGYAITAIILAVALWRARDNDTARRLPRLGVVAALMLVGMSVELGIIGYHVNLSVLAGILLGPWLRFIAAFIVNLILALFGHGGITVAGLNALLIGSETILGWVIFRALASRNRLEVRYAAALAVLLTLAISTTLMVGIVALTQTQPALVFSGPSADAPFLRFELGAGEEDNPMASLDLGRFAQLVYFFGAVGWILEAVFTAVVIGFFARARPDLIEMGGQVGTRAD